MASPEGQTIVRDCDGLTRWHRTGLPIPNGWHEAGKPRHELVSEIAALQQRIERLRIALKPIAPYADHGGLESDSGLDCALTACGTIARNALAEDDEAAGPRMGERG